MISKHNFIWPAAAGMALTAGMLFAQTATPTPTPQKHAGWMAQRFDRLAAELNLTDAQKTQAKAIFANAAQQVKALAPQLKQGHQAIQTLTQSGDQTQFNAQIQGLANTQGSLMAQMAVIHATAEFQFRALLTPDQQTKFDQLHAQMGPGMRHGMGMRQGAGRWQHGANP